MIEYYNYDVKLSGRVVQLLIDYSIEFETESDESCFVISPPCWDSIVTESVDYSKYDCYHIYACKLPHGSHNRITDYKKIWGLNNISMGIYDNYYDTINERIYFGIKKEIKTAQLSKLCWHPSSIYSIILLAPPSSNSWNQIFDVFRLSQYDFTGESTEFLEKLQAIITDSCVIEYRVEQKICMNVCVPDSKVSGLLLCAEQEKIPETVCQ